MLTLPIKKKWYDMILSGEKKEEYRAMTDYYHTRLFNLFYDDFVAVSKGEKTVTDNLANIRFRNGYNANSPSFVATCRLRIGTGKPEWGAVDGVEYFVLEIIEINKDYLERRYTES